MNTHTKQMHTQEQERQGKKPCNIRKHNTRSGPEHSGLTFHMIAYQRMSSAYRGVHGLGLHNTGGVDPLPCEALGHVS